MGKRSTKVNKSIYQLSRENAHMTRSTASEGLHISEHTLFDYENSRIPDPKTVLNMSEIYDDVYLCNKYCKTDCAIGHRFKAIAINQSVTKTAVEIFSSLNKLENEKDRLIEIFADEKISTDETSDMEKIEAELKKLDSAIESLKMWFGSTKSSCFDKKGE